MLKFPEQNIIIDQKLIKKWLDEARKSNYDKNFERMASLLFFQGGAVPKKDGIDDAEYKKGKAFLRSWLMDFSPKHEHKELVAGYILSRISVLT